MKKNIKGLIGIALAASMVIAGTVSSFADDSFTLKGDIGAITMDVTVPTSAVALTINPYKAKQIVTPNSSVLTNGSSDDTYKITLAGYTATATPKTAANAITFKSTDADGNPLTTAVTANDYGTSVKKEAYLEIKLGPSMADTTGAEDDSGNLDPSSITAAVSSGPLKKGTANYTAGSATYTKLTETTTDEFSVVINPDEVVPVYVEGSLNPGAPTWEQGDSFTIIPIFKFTPVIAAASSDNG